MLLQCNRPEHIGAMGGTLLPEMLAALAEGTSDGPVRAFVVPGERRAWLASNEFREGGCAFLEKHEPAWAKG